MSYFHTCCYCGRELEVKLRSNNCLMSYPCPCRDQEASPAAARKVEQFQEGVALSALKEHEPATVPGKGYQMNDRNHGTAGELRLAAERRLIDHERGKVDEPAAKLLFASDPELRVEFFGSEAAYLAYLRAESRGEVRTIPVGY